MTRRLGCLKSRLRSHATRTSLIGGRDRWDIEIGASNVNEANNFRSQSYSLGVDVGVSDAFTLRMMYRQVDVSGTGSSDVVGETPYAQAAQSAHSELVLDFMYPLFGRSKLHASKSLDR